MHHGIRGANANMPHLEERRIMGIESPAAAKAVLDFCLAFKMPAGKDKKAAGRNSDSDEDAEAGAAARLGPDVWDPTQYPEGSYAKEGMKLTDKQSVFLGFSSCEPYREDQVLLVALAEVNGTVGVRVDMSRCLGARHVVHLPKVYLFRLCRPRCPAAWSSLT